MTAVREVGHGPVCLGAALHRLGTRARRVRLRPQCGSGDARDRYELPPPDPFIAVPVQFAVMGRQSGTVNSSLTLRASARACANFRWWASDGLRPQTRQGWRADEIRGDSRSRSRSVLPIGVTDRLPLSLDEPFR